MRIKKVILSLIIISTLLKMSLVGKGSLHNSDENRYTATGIALRSIYNGNFQEATQLLFSTKGRPGAALINIFPNIIQIFSAKTFGLFFYEPSSFFGLFLFNYIIFCLILVIHFKFSKLFLIHKTYSYLSVLLLGCLTNSYIYLRHAVPYDISLLIIYYCIYKVFSYKKNINYNQLDLIKIGFLAFFGYLTYPGYVFIILIIPFMMLFLDLNKSYFKKNIVDVISLLFGMFICLISFELFSWYGNTSYINSAVTLSKTINQGTFSETYTFLLKYLIQVENFNGYFIISCLILLLYSFTKSSTEDNPLRKIKLLFYFIISILLIIGTLGVFFQKIVLYGRLIHQFIPFIVLFSIYFIEKNKTKFRKFKPLILLPIFIFCSFIFNLTNLLKYDYPKDVLWRIYKSYKYENISEISEFKNQSHFPYKPRKKNIKFTKNNKGKIRIVNSNYFMPGTYKSFEKYIPSKKEKLLEKKLHVINFKAYQFEGLSSDARKNIDSFDIYIKTFKSD